MMSGSIYCKAIICTKGEIQFVYESCRFLFYLLVYGTLLALEGQLKTILTAVTCIDNMVFCHYYQSHKLIPWRPKQRLFVGHWISAY